VPGPPLKIAAGLLIAGFVVTLLFKRPQHVSHYRVPAVKSVPG
jgi:hypothetical protein